MSALLVALLLAVSPARASQERPEYTLTFSAESPRRFHVEADLPVAKNEIEMSDYLSEPLANGNADFIENLRARDAAGRPVGLTHLGKGRWKLQRPLARVRLDYDVVLKHEKVKWRLTGIFARGYAANEALFFFGSVAFITGDPEFKVPATIRFKVPRAWQVASAWKESNGRKNVYEAKSWSELRHSGTMVGRLAQRHIRSGPLEVIVSGPREFEPTIAQIGDPMGPAIESFRSSMGGSPAGKFAFFFSADPTIDTFLGAETTDNTISMLMDKPLDAQNRRLYTYIIAHEVFHLWNAVAIAGQNSRDAYWFSEGFSVYGAMLGLYQSGQATEEQFLSDIAAGYDWYLAGHRSAGGKLSLRQAGEDKGKNTDLIYYGGMAAAVALEIEGRSRAAGGFPELMRLAYAEFGTTGKRYSHDDLVRLMGLGAGTDMAGFLKRHVDGTEIIPLPDYLRKAGLLLSTTRGKSIITRDPKASAEQRSLFPPPVRTGPGGR